MTRFFCDISLTLNKIRDIFPTCFKFPDISRFSRQVVTLVSHTEPCIVTSSPLREIFLAAPPIPYCLPSYPSPPHTCRSLVGSEAAKIMTATSVAYVYPGIARLYFNQIFPTPCGPFKVCPHAAVGAAAPLIRQMVVLF